MSSIKTISHHWLNKPMTINNHHLYSFEEFEDRPITEKAILMNISYEEARRLVTVYERDIYGSFLKILKYGRFRSKSEGELVKLPELIEHLDLKLSFRSICMRTRRKTLDIKIISSILELVKDELLYSDNDNEIGNSIQILTNTNLC